MKRRCVSKEDCIMYVPLLETLQALLKNEVVLSEVELDKLSLFFNDFMFINR